MRFRRLLAGTTGLTFFLLLLGVYTKEVGADLTCGMRWPLCDGGVFGLFPANMASFVEWFHRLIALVVGLLIIWTVYRAIREYGRGSRITRAVGGALLLLPVQAGLGALTVLKARLFTVQTRLVIEPLISVAHYGTGVLLFTCLVAGTLWAYENARGASSVQTDMATPAAAEDRITGDD
ncbi:MAG: COX15/CtaA family protein [Halobacteriales archaeon]|nr:COX15/CtaA family protein [Halobacteriales archaeon]